MLSDLLAPGLGGDVLGRILEANGLTVDVVLTERPGRVTYEDRHQVVAEPFRETTT